MNAITVFAVATAMVSSVCLGSELEVRMQHKVAMERLREVVAPICGKSINFDCAIGFGWEPRHCPIEYLVIVAPKGPGQVARRIWIGLDTQGRVLGMEPDRDLLCPRA